jgi:hypothetical protein
VKFLESNIKKGEHIHSPFDFYLNKYFQIIFQFAPTRLRTFPAMFPLLLQSFCCPPANRPRGNKKDFRFNRGYNSTLLGVFQTFGIF